MSSRAFSISDLIIAICVAALLLLFMPQPSMDSTLQSARRAQAKNDVVQIASAVSAYKTEYEKLPSASASIQNVDGSALQALMGSNANGLNPRQIVFLEVQQAKRGKSGLTNGMFVDPWGAPYKILYDTDYNAVITNAGSAYITDREVRKNVAVWTDPDLHRDKVDAARRSGRSVTSWK